MGVSGIGSGPAFCLSAAMTSAGTDPLEPLDFHDVVPASVRQLGEETSIPVFFFSGDKALYVPEDSHDAFLLYARAHPQLLHDATPSFLVGAQWHTFRGFFDMSRERDPASGASWNLDLEASE